MLSDREMQILEIIEEYIRVNGFSPTVREIGQLIGLKSSSTVHGHLEKLTIKGYITKMGNFPRTLKILKMPKKVTSQNRF